MVGAIHILKPEASTGIGMPPTIIEVKEDKRPILLLLNGEAVPAKLFEFFLYLSDVEEAIEAFSNDVPCVFLEDDPTRFSDNFIHFRRVDLVVLKSDNWKSWMLINPDSQLFRQVVRNFSIS